MANYANKSRKQKSTIFNLPSPDPFPKLSGRQLYDYRPTITGLNWTPIEEHLAYIVGGSEVDNSQSIADVSFEDIARRVVRDGYVLYYFGAMNSCSCSSYDSIVTAVDEGYAEGTVLQEESGGFIDNIIYSCHQYAIEQVSEDVYRIWRQYPSEWLVTTYYVSSLGDWKLSENPEDTYYISTEDIIYYAFDAGLITPAQDTFWDIESIWEKIRKQRTNAALARIFIGYVGDAEDQFHNLMSQDTTYLNFPEGVSVVDVANSNLSIQFMDQANQLTTLFYRQVHLVNASDSTNESGIAKKMKMLPELTYQNKKRMQIEEVCNAFGIEVSFSVIEIYSTAENLEKYTLYKTLRDDGVMSEEEFTERSRDIFGL